MMNCLDTVDADAIVSADRLELKQIEFNAISSSFAGLTEQMGDLHRSVVLSHSAVKKTFWHLDFFFIICVVYKFFSVNIIYI